jgi:hypothetical protein
MNEISRKFYARAHFISVLVQMLSMYVIQFRAYMQWNERMFVITL